MSEVAVSVKGQPVVVRDPTTRGVVHIIVGERDVLQLDLANCLVTASALEDDNQHGSSSIVDAEGNAVVVSWKAARARSNRATISKKTTQKYRAVLEVDGTNARMLAAALRGTKTEVNAVGDPAELPNDATGRGRRTLDKLHEDRTGTRGKLVLTDYDHAADADADDDDAVYHGPNAMNIGRYAPPLVVEVEWGDEVLVYTLTPNPLDGGA